MAQPAAKHVENSAHQSQRRTPQLRILRPEELSPAPDSASSAPDSASPAPGSDAPQDSAAGLPTAGPASANHPPVKAAGAELLEQLESVSQRLEKATPQEILAWAVAQYAPKFSMATAFGPEGMCIIHMLSEIAPETPIFNLETGYQFQETLELREEVKRRYGIEVELKQPETTVAEYEHLHGGPLYKTDPNRCCMDRKIHVLRKAAVGLDAWASAIRRDQSPDRARAPIVGWDKKFGLVKVSPLANWTKRDVWGFIAKHDVPYNPLHDRGYPSVGCWPCTRSILEGEDERAGRWSGFAKTECGLHSSD